MSSLCFVHSNDIFFLRDAVSDTKRIRNVILSAQIIAVQISDH